MNEKKIAHSIFLTFLFILVLSSITTYNDYRLSEIIDHNREFFSRSTEVVKNITRFQRNMLSMVSGLQGYSLTGKRVFIETYEAANKDNDDILKELPTIVTDTSQTRLLEEIKILNAQWTDDYLEPLKVAKSLSSVNNKSIEEFNRIYKYEFASGKEDSLQRKLDSKLKNFVAFEYQLRSKREAELNRVVDRTKAIAYFLTIISIIIGLLIIVILVRRISSRIKQMTSFAENIARGNYNSKIESLGKDELNSLGRSLNIMAEELSKNIALLERQNQELDQFAHIVSHDMKSPLRGISNVISWIEEDHGHELNAKVLEYISLIKGRIFRAENLIEGLLTYARIDKEAAEKEKVDVNELVEEIIEGVSNKNLTAKIGKLPTVNTEKILLFQVFSNLISNAVKYNDKPHPEISVYSQEYPDKFEFFVKDNGIGIAANHYHRIFTIFQTLREKDSFESTGVGLAIVKKILDGKKQTIEVISTIGEGTTFSFTWPKDQQ